VAHTPSQAPASRPAPAPDALWALPALCCAALQVVCSVQGPLGVLFLDLHSRPGKYPGSVLFPIRCGRALPGGGYQQPILALVCDFGGGEGGHCGC
jgi:hypothetical protein